MSEWKESKLKDLTTKIGSGATPTGGDNSYKIEGISLIRSQNVLDFQFSYDGLAFIDDEQAEALRNVTVQREDVLLNITGDSVARVCKVPEKILPARVNQHVAIIRSNKEKLDSDYLLYYLQAKKEHLLSISEIGATRRALTKSMIEDFDLIIPPLPEQQFIASILSSLDDKIDLLHRQNKTLEALAETLFRQWFVEEAEEGADNGKLGDIADINPTYQLKKGELSSYLEMSNVSTSTFNPEGWYKREFSSGMKFQNGDTLIARITPCLENGKTCYVTFLDEEEIGWGSTEYIVIRMKKPFHPFISYIIAKDKDFRDFAISSMSGSSGRQRAQADVIKEYDIKIPSLAIIEELNLQLAGITKKLETNAKQIRTLIRLRDTLLPTLMSGEVRVKLEEEEAVYE
jgi:type I restriction enzyme S subunit